MQKPHRLGRYSWEATGFNGVEGMQKSGPRETFSGRRAAALQSDQISQITVPTPGDGARWRRAPPQGGSSFTSLELMWARAVLAPSLLMNAANSLLRQRRSTHHSSPRKLAGLSSHLKIGGGRARLL